MAEGCHKSDTERGCFPEKGVKIWRRMGKGGTESQPMDWGNDRERKRGKTLSWITRKKAPNKLCHASQDLGGESPLALKAPKWEMRRRCGEGRV